MPAEPDEPSQSNGLSEPTELNEPTELRFRVGDIFPADDLVSRWLTVCCVALNEVSRVHRHMLPALEAGDEPATVIYFARLTAAHIYEAAKFLARSERGGQGLH